MHFQCLWLYFITALHSCTSSSFVQVLRPPLLLEEEGFLRFGGESEELVLSLQSSSRVADELVVVAKSLVWMQSALVVVETSWLSGSMGDISTVSSDAASCEDPPVESTSEFVLQSRELFMGEVDMLGKSSSFQTSLKSYYYHHQRTEAYNYRIIVASI